MARELEMTPARQDVRSTLPRIPGATYRLQFNASFTLEHARAIVDYLHVLGVTDVYASPLFQAAPESTHGYDTCSHSQIGECLGGEAAFQEFSAALQERGMALLLDVVPNHMGACASNAWWWDVLKLGRESKFAPYFDIDWERGRGKVLLPMLGRPLPEVLRAGELKVIRSSDDGEWLLTYFENQFPISSGTFVPKHRDAVLNETEWLELLDAQHYRLAFWRVGPHEINYRRFFDVTGLVAVRMEDPQVFTATHERLLQLIRDGTVTGLRVDHPDGLRDPREYFERLQRAAGPLYIVGEKILSASELPTDWPIAGTTGYDFLIQLNALFVARQNEHALTHLYHEFIGTTESFEAVAYKSKKRVLETSFAGDADALATRLREIAAAAFEGRDLTLCELRAAIVELIACFGVYRTYVTAGSQTLSAPDAEVLRRAVKLAKQRAPRVHAAIDFLASVLGLAAQLAPQQHAAAREFILRFQQLSGPAAAKGIEDTAFYKYFRLVSLNEVGGAPGEFGIGAQEFHARNQRRAEHWPHSLLATATHDTKRGEDTRARINVLSELPDEWRAAVFRWRELNARHKTIANGTPAPDANDEYLFYQALIGTWTSEGSIDQYRQRIDEYMLKAIKEAKCHTSWTDPDESYEKATQEFVTRVLAPAHGKFLGDFVSFHQKVAFFGVFNSLSQTLLKLTSPGVPDLYQGCELWDFSLVDPDNRRPVDYARRRELLEHVRAADLRTMDARVGAAKLFLIQGVLNFRNLHRGLFDRGEYIPLQVRGVAREHVCVFARTHGKDAAITIAPRLVCTLMRGLEAAPLGEEAWSDTEIQLPPSLSGRLWRNVLTRETLDASKEIRVSEVLRSFSVALITSSAA